jgi:para-nitrobenzyl esterase
MFDRYLPGDNNGAWHAGDLWYWFGTFHKSWRPFEEKDHELKNAMISYLTNFAKTGNPNSEGLPTWDAYGKKQPNAMFFGEGDIRMDKVKRGKLYKFMLTKKAVGF